MRKTHLDVIRILACFLVIVNHTNSRIFLSCAPSPTWFVSLTYFFVSKTAVPMFLLVSGALLLNKTDDYKKTLSRFLRILEALVLFSLLYYLRDCLMSGDAVDLRAFVLSIYKTNITNAFWYLYLYLGIIVMLPLLQRMFSGFEKRDYIYFMVISLLVLGSVPIIKHYVPALADSAGLHLPLFSAYLGLMAAGQYFGSVRPPEKRGAITAGVLLCVCVALCVAGTYFEYRADSSWYLFFDDRTSVLITVPSVCIFVIIQYVFAHAHISERLSRVLAYLGRLTFGAYLLSDLVIGATGAVYETLTAYIHPIPAVVLWELMIFLVCLAVTSVLVKIPYIKKLL